VYRDGVFQLKIYYGRMVNRSLQISVDKQMYSRRNDAFGKIHKFYSCVSEQWKNVTALGYATGPSLNLAE
jgi:hypothetical protein